MQEPSSYCSSLSTSFSGKHERQTEQTHTIRNIPTYVQFHACQCSFLNVCRHELHVWKSLSHTETCVNNPKHYSAEFCEHRFTTKPAEQRYLFEISTHCIAQSWEHRFIAKPVAQSQSCEKSYTLYQNFMSRAFLPSVTQGAYCANDRTCIEAESGNPEDCCTCLPI